MAKPLQARILGGSRTARLWDLALPVTAPYRVLARSRALVWVITGQACSTLGDGLFTVAITVLAYTSTHSVAIVAALTVARLLPYLTVLPMAGMLLDRWNRRWILVGGNTGRALCMVVLSLLPPSTGFALAFPLVFAYGALTSFVTPTLKSVVPDVAPEGTLARTNGLMSQVDSLGHVVGPALAGWLALLSLDRGAVLAAAVAFAGAAAGGMAGQLASLPVAAPTREKEEGWWPEVAAGFRFLFRENDGVLRACALTLAGLALLGGSYWTLAVVLSAQVFHLGNQGTGFLETAYGVGGVAGALVIVALGQREHARRLLMLGAAASSVAAVFFGLSPTGAVALACMAAVGVADVLAESNAVLLLQASAPAEMVGRVLAALETTLVAAMLVGAATVGPLIALVGPRGATVVLGLVGLGVLALCLGRLRRLDDAVAVRVFLRAVPLFARLSLATLDKLAARLTLEEHPTGAVIMREGEPGDTLYIVQDGELSVYSQPPDAPRGEELGPRVDTILAQDYFGEAALLREAPRTATVRTDTRARLYRLGRADFQWLLARSAELRAALAATDSARRAHREQVMLTRPW
jgi:MFS family permease